MAQREDLGVARVDKAALHKHERFWLADGNAVIELDGIGFRVHQSWIAKHSKRIAAILPDKGKQGDRLEEITLEVSDTLKAIDLEALLLFYENPGDYRDCIETPTLMSLIRATTILGFDSDRAWLVKELEALWPSELGELVINTKPRIDAPEMAALARTCDIDALLKPAFYDMARTSVFGLGMDEPEQISRADILQIVRLREYLSCRWTQLAAADEALACQNVRDAPSNDGEGPSSLSENDGDEKLALCSTASADMGCNCPSATTRRDAWVRLVHHSGIFARYQYDPVCGLTALTNIAWTDDWCKDCMTKRKALWHEQQGIIWEDVGDRFKGRMTSGSCIPTTCLAGVVLQSAGSPSGRASG
ncbi:hypothetical protein P692DRAFT_20829537 [Suillus brevipes Sb2]|nr:hypothetical protein P692DRAFT_20829537 [Suillus brevipes Sb2]